MVAPRDLASRQWKIVRALFIRQPEVAAGSLPFGAMRRDPASARAFVREEMSEFVTQRPLDFRVAKGTQPRIQPDEGTPGKGEPRRAAHPRIPLHAHPPGEGGRAGGPQDLADLREQRFHGLRRDLRRKLCRSSPTPVRAFGSAEEALEKVELHRAKH